MTQATSRGGGPEHVRAVSPTLVLGDERRYFLGPFQAPHATTERMVAAVSPYWTPDQVRAFEERVRSYAPPPPPEDTNPKDRMRWRHMVRRTQLGLLRSLPARQRSAAASRQVDEDERRYGSHRGITYSGVRTIGSVIEAEGMAKAKDDDIVNAFVELPDATGWDKRLRAREEKCRQEEERIAVETRELARAQDALNAQAASLAKQGPVRAKTPVGPDTSALRQDRPIER